MSLQRKTLAEMLTFTRAGTAFYFGSDGLLKTAAANEPRFDYDPVTLAPRGLLIEEPRTNLVLRSAEFDNAVWAKSNATVAANATSTPLGLADDLIETTAAGTHGANQVVNVTSGTTYAMSVYAKAKGRSLLRIGAANLGSYAVFDLNTGTVQHTDAGTTARIEAIGGGVYRCAVTQTATATEAYNWIIRTQSSTSEWPGSGAYTGNGVSGVSIIGAQIEAGAFATSYIPTTTAATTRGADNCFDLTISDWFNHNEGTFAVEADTFDLSENRGLYSVSAGSGATEYFGFVTTGGNVLHPVRVANVVQGDNLQVGVVSANTVFKVARAYKANDLRAATNGTLSTADTSATLPTGLDRLGVGIRGDTGFRINGHIRRIRYWPNRLSDALLQELTA